MIRRIIYFLPYVVQLDCFLSFVLSPKLMLQHFSNWRRAISLALSLSALRSLVLRSSVLRSSVLRSSVLISSVDRLKSSEMLKSSMWRRIKSFSFRSASLRAASLRSSVLASCLFPGFLSLSFSFCYRLCVSMGNLGTWCSRIVESARIQLLPFDVFSPALEARASARLSMIGSGALRFASLLGRSCNLVQPRIV